MSSDFSLLDKNITRLENLSQAMIVAKDFRTNEASVSGAFVTAVCSPLTKMTSRSDSNAPALVNSFFNLMTGI